MLQNLVKNRSSLIVWAVLQNPLNHSTTVCVDAQILYMLLDWYDDEIDLLGGHLLYTFLDDMVSILVEDALQNRVLELTN